MSTTTETKGADWATVRRASEDRLKDTKVFIYNVGTKEEPLEARFVIRMLKAHETENIAEKGVAIDPSARGGDRVRVQAGAIKRLVIRAGVVEGPPGWQGSNDDLERICADPPFADALSGAIERFTHLPKETREGFR